jgi:hypothetical protein
LWCVAGEGRACKMLIDRDEVLIGAMNIGEITAPTTRDTNLITGPFIMLQH